MLNTLKSDFYKLKRSKSLWICLIIICLLLMMSVLIIKQNYELYQQQGLANLIPVTAREFAYSAPASADLTIFLAIFAALYFVTEFTNGTIKNTVTAGVPRWQMYISKFIMLTSICSLCVFACMLFCLLFSLIFFDYGVAFTFSEFMKLIGIWLLSTLFLAAYSAIYMFVGVLTRNIAGTIAICLLVFTLFAGTFVSVLQMIPSYYPDLNLDWLYDIGKYFLSVMMSESADVDELTSADVWRMIYMPVAYILAFGGGGLLIFYKKDI